MAGGGIKLGNAAPLGLLAFGMTTALLMITEMGWVEHHFLEHVFGYMAFYGGLTQLVVGIFELLSGSTFGFAAFSSYGAYWMAQALIFNEDHDLNSTFEGAEHYPQGKCAFFSLWGVVTFVFWVCTFRKNAALCITFGLLTLTFFLLSGAAIKGDGHESILKVAASFGFMTGTPTPASREADDIRTRHESNVDPLASRQLIHLCCHVAALAAFYTGFAELINEEFGYHLLPGLEPLAKSHKTELDQALMEKIVSYSARSNTLFATFRGLQIGTLRDIQTIREGIESKIKAASTGKVHVIIDYKDATIAQYLAKAYWEMTQAHLPKRRARSPRP